MQYDVLGHLIPAPNCIAEKMNTHADICFITVLDITGPTHFIQRSSANMRLSAYKKYAH